METELCACGPPDWKIRSIEDVCERVTSGGTPSRHNPAYYAGGRWPWVKTQELKDTWVEDTEERITDEAVHGSSAKVLPANTVLLAMYGATVGQLGMLRKPMTCNQACCAMIVDTRKADFRYLFYLVLSVRTQLRNLATGAAQQNLSGELIRHLRFPFPGMDEQRAIAHILGTLDDKIELNRRMNETLEAMGRALFKSWFMDFDPVRAKAAGRDPGLPKPLADLFPDSFEDSEMGEIPEGWTIQSLGCLAALNPEVWTRHTRPGVIRYVDLSGAKWGRVETVTTHRHQDAPSRAQRVLRPGDTIVGTVRPGNGSYAYITDSGLTGSTGFAVLRPVRPEYREFVYLAATTRENIEALAHLADGGAYPAVRPEVVAHTQVVGAPLAVIGLFARTTAPLLESMARSQRESLGLAALRDALLPKLISGELRVKSAGEMVDRELA
jgi:type I restriction enzyme S subunit